MVAAVPKKAFSRDYRKKLPKQWAGMSSKELREITGVLDAIFCPNGRFIAGAEFLEGKKIS